MVTKFSTINLAMKFNIKLATQGYLYTVIFCFQIGNLKLGKLFTYSGIIF